MFKFISKFFDANQKELNRLQPLVDKINNLEPEFKNFKKDDFTAKTAQFKEQLSGDKTLDDILPQAYALVRQASFQTIGERHFDVQLIAGIVLHQGKIAEQKTGEGKTLSATLPLYLNALTGKGTHLVTVNDYLARRDCGWMGPIYHLLGLTCSAIISEQSFIYDPDYKDKKATDWRLRHLRPVPRKQAYQADITYGINSEFGFDYLRDNMATSLDQLVQTGFHYAIVDEVDSVLIDEARTPHIISAPDTKPTKRYYDMARLVDKLTPKIDYEVDEKLRTAHLTDHGIGKIEKMFNIPDIYEKDFETVHLLEAALKAKTLFARDKDYVVKDNQVIIVDEFTGRLLPGRRFSEGIHQAIEAKENVTIQRESKTLATISLQNYFRMYQKLAGMTGTAATEAEEFKKIYDLDVIIIPTNKPLIRKDHSDFIYKTQRAKFAAVVREIIKAHKKGQPVLVGTTSIEKNEIVGNFLKRKGIPHNLLNAKNHAREAQIIADAGKKGSVTVATNMAGRGVDIVLGGSPPDKYTATDKKQYQKDRNLWKKDHQQVVNLGGLLVLGTERHESRRIDNQLRGRSGRQGDPGATRFFVALDDDIMRLFGGDQIAKIMTTFKMPEDVPLEHPMVTKSIEQAQVKVEGFNFDIRKHLVEYDDVLNKQREIIYKKRRKILKNENSQDLKKNILDKISAQIENYALLVSPEGVTNKEIKKIVKEFSTIIPFDSQSQNQIITALEKNPHPQKIIEFLNKIAIDTYQKREEDLTPQVMRQIERFVSLQVIDHLWMEHLTAIDDLREGIGLRGYGQRDPLVEYKNEAYSMFERLIANIDSEITHRIYKVQPVGSLKPRQPENIVAKAAGTGSPSAPATPRPKRTSPSPQKTIISHPKGAKKIGRNDPCPCGSGKKYKKCHLNNPTKTSQEQRLFSLYFSDPKAWEKETGIKRK